MPSKSQSQSQWSVSCQQSESGSGNSPYIYHLHHIPGSTHPAARLHNHTYTMHIHTAVHTVTLVYDNTEHTHATLPRSHPTLPHVHVHTTFRSHVPHNPAARSIFPYMWVILCLVGYKLSWGTFKLVGERLAAFARARKRSDVTRGHMWARSILELVLRKNYKF